MRFPGHALHRPHPRRVCRRERGAALRSARHGRSAALPSATSFSAARSARSSPDKPSRCATFDWPGINGAAISATTLRDRRKTVESLLDLRRGSPPAAAAEPLPEQKVEREQGPVPSSDIVMNERRSVPDHRRVSPLRRVLRCLPAIPLYRSVPWTCRASAKPCRLAIMRPGIVSRLCRRSGTPMIRRSPPSMAPTPSFTRRKS